MVPPSVPKPSERSRPWAEVAAIQVVLALRAAGSGARRRSHEGAFWGLVEPGDTGVGMELGVMLGGVRAGHEVGISKLESPISPLVYAAPIAQGD